MLVYVLYQFHARTQKSPVTPSWFVQFRDGCGCADSDCHRLHLFDRCRSRQWCSGDGDGGGGGAADSDRDNAYGGGGGGDESEQLQHLLGPPYCKNNATS